ncbi:hypothetical protein ERIC1_10p00250 (plasmid) [Paenibacillus larvae subsp. larvae DSM 25719]|jgi:hypothetical protein|uniref:helix-turn-helix domain-containing protein n=1 Tax=Paenibacillus larvae TaxID=1464 RepID=UPI0003DC149E|nr:helix-turn-helix domain-containing protein [Paenibacillus larvae]ETK25554.1 hypothetical protein ERIC1_10p00250 [Paenibacillus larvae subsp. larvae DSM 25719]
MVKSKAEKLVMGTDEAGAKWGKSQDWIKRLCKEGKLDAVRIGKTWVVLRDQEYPYPEKE